MKTIKLILFLAIGAILVFSVALALKDDAVQRGKAHFNDPEFGGGTAGKSCATCHPDGEGMAEAAKKKWKDSEGKEKTLQDMINMCIVGALQGKEIDKNSQEMKDMVAYIKFLGKEAKIEEEMKMEEAEDEDLDDEEMENPMDEEEEEEEEEDLEDEEEPGDN